MPTLIRWIVAGALFVFLIPPSNGQGFRSLPSSNSNSRKRAQTPASGLFGKQNAGQANRKDLRKGLGWGDLARTGPYSAAQPSGWSGRWFVETPASPPPMPANVPWTWNGSPSSLNLESANQSVPPPEEEHSLLKGCGVSISSQGFWSMPRRDFQVVPLSGEGSPFSTKLVEVKGHPAETKSVVKEADGPPMATPVVGKPGFVELSFDPRGLPYVDVRGVKPGSELQIVDPLDVGKTIRFRIPDEEKPEK